MNVLIITGAIDINNIIPPFTTLTDTKKRFIQYANSLEYAIIHYTYITHIVFCENTNYVFPNSNYYIDLASKHGKALEILTFQGDSNKITSFGKGYGEGEIIRYALTNSNIMKECDYFFKLTGRLIVQNMNRVMLSTKNDNAFIYYPSRIYYLNKDHISTVFYKVNKSLYISQLQNIFLDVNEFNDIYIEHLFNKKLNDTSISSFKALPVIIGESGSTGLSYELNLIHFTIEKIYNYIGVHNLKRTFLSNIFISCIAFLINIRKTIKNINKK